MCDLSSSSESDHEDNEQMEDDGAWWNIPIRNKNLFLSMKSVRLPSGKNVQVPKPYSFVLFPDVVSRTALCMKKKIETGCGVVLPYEERTSNPNTIILLDDNYLMEHMDLNVFLPNDAFSYEFVQDLLRKQNDPESIDLNAYMYTESSYEPYDANQILHHHKKWSDLIPLETPPPLWNWKERMETLKCNLNNNQDEELQVEDVEMDSAADNSNVINLGEVSLLAIASSAEILTPDEILALCTPPEPIVSPSNTEDNNITIVPATPESVENQCSNISQQLNSNIGIDMVSDSDESTFHEAPPNVKELLSAPAPLLQHNSNIFIVSEASDSDDQPSFSFHLSEPSPIPSSKNQETLSVPAPNPIKSDLKIKGDIFNKNSRFIFTPDVLITPGNPVITTRNSTPIKTYSKENQNQVKSTSARKFSSVPSSSRPTVSTNASTPETPSSSAAKQKENQVLGNSSPVTLIQSEVDQTPSKKSIRRQSNKIPIAIVDLDDDDGKPQTSEESAAPLSNNRSSQNGNSEESTESFAPLSNKSSQNGKSTAIVQPVPRNSQPDEEEILPDSDMFPVIPSRASTPIPKPVLPSAVPKAVPSRRSSVLSSSDDSIHFSDEGDRASTSPQRNAQNKNSKKEFRKKSWRMYTNSESQALLDIIVVKDWGLYVMGISPYQRIVNEKLLTAKGFLERTPSSLAEHFRKQIHPVLMKAGTGQRQTKFKISPQNLATYLKRREEAKQHSHANVLPP